MTGRRRSPAPPKNQGAKLNEWLTAWASQVRDELAEAQPVMPPEVDGRPEQIWEPLVAIGDLAWRDTLARAERDGTEPPRTAGWAERAEGRLPRIGARSGHGTGRGRRIGAGRVRIVR